MSMMKQFLLTTCAMLVLLPPVAFGQGYYEKRVEYNGVRYMIDGDREACVIGLADFKQSGVVTIPDKFIAPGTTDDWHTVNQVSLNDFDNGFASCENLTQIILPETVVKFGPKAFSYCKSLTNVNLPVGLTEIGRAAFSYCDNIKSIDIPSGVTYLDETFKECKNLASVTLPKGLLTLADGVFKGCKSLTSLDIPEGVTEIGNACFAECTAIKQLTLPKGLTYIGRSVFALSGITSITIPEGITRLGEETFYACPELESVTLPSTLTSIYHFAFSECVKLASITLPAAIKSIEQEAFKGCKRLKRIECLAEVPPAVGSSGFEGVSATVYVPASSVDAYKRAKGWRDLDIQILGQDPTPVLYASENFRLSTDYRTLTIHEAEGKPLQLFNAIGGQLHATCAIPNSSYRVTVPTAGVYIVRVGSQTRKVVIP